MINRREAIASGAALLAAGTHAFAQGRSKAKLRFSAVFPDQDLRAEAYREFGDAIKDEFEFEPYFGGTLFKQGTELVALQRGNLDMANLAPADISKQAPAWSL